MWQPAVFSVYSEETVKKLAGKLKQRAMVWSGNMPLVVIAGYILAGWSWLKHWRLNIVCLETEEVGKPGNCLRSLLSILFLFSETTCGEIVFLKSSCSCGFVVGPQRLVHVLLKVDECLHEQPQGWRQLCVKGLPGRLPHVRYFKKE